MKNRSVLLCLRILFFPILFLPLVFQTACNSRNDAQQRFEENAFSEPQGITETNISGKVINEDKDDWRIGPLFQGLVNVQNPAFPNPVEAGQTIKIQLNITGVESVSGIEVLIKNENLQWQTIFIEQQIQTGLFEIRLKPIEFTYTDNYQNAIGLHRVYVFDLNNSLITYGDVRIK